MIKSISPYLIFVICLTSLNVFTQSDVKSQLSQTTNQVKKILTEDSLSIKGSINTNTLYNIVTQSENGNRWDYRLNARLNISYRGISIPIFYSFSNGRTISSLNGPSFKTPTFSNLGASPTKGKFTLHLGDRFMNFSKYTYSGLRFKGIGGEYNSDQFKIQMFKGKLSTLSPSDLNFNSNIESEYSRRSYGVKSEVQISKISLGATVFTANDDILEFDPIQEKLNSPKENTALEFEGTVKINDSLSFNYVHSISALTSNALDPRIDITTHNTIYNMLGLFEKKSSSIYKFAKKASLIYKINVYSLSLDYESVDNNYRSLGSLMFDNNYTSLSNNIAAQFKKISFNNVIGLRKNKVSNIEQGRNFQLVLNSNMNYQHSDRFNVSLGYSNMRNTQNVYQRSSMSTSIDSIYLAQLNTSFRLNTSYILDEEKRSIINGYISLQKRNGIQRDSVQLNNEINNLTLGILYSTTLGKHELSANSNFLNNINSNFSSKIYNVNISDKVAFTEKSNFELSIGFNHIRALGVQSNQIVGDATYSYRMHENFDLGIIGRIDVGNADQFNKINLFSLGIDANYSFN